MWSFREDTFREASTWKSEKNMGRWGGDDIKMVIRKYEPCGTG
jgi:hypothetical protein